VGRGELAGNRDGAGTTRPAGRDYSRSLRESHIYPGTVEGLVPGTGSVFALFPLDNAAGNFIHIVERVPLRIALRKDEILKNPFARDFPPWPQSTSRDRSNLLALQSRQFPVRSTKLIFILMKSPMLKPKVKNIMDNLVQKNAPLALNCKSSESVTIKNSRAFR